MKPSWIRHVLWILEFAALWPFGRILQLLPESMAISIGHVIGRLVYRISIRDRRWCQRNLELVFGANLNSRQRDRLGQATYEHHARTILEILRMDEAWIHDRCFIDGLPNYHAWRAKNPGRGIVAISGHTGNIEILGRFAKEIDIKITMISRPLDNPYLERVLRACRERYGLSIVSRGSPSLRDTLRRLRAGEAIGIALDLNTAVGGVFVDVMGVPAATARGAAVLALKENAGVFVVNTFRQSDGAHRVLISRPIEVSRTDDFEHDVAVNTQRFAREVERHILEHPDQYQWQHPRWRTRPDGSTWSLEDPVEAMLSARRTPACRPPARFRGDELSATPARAA